MIQHALISVSDKTGIVDFAKALSAMGVSILSTGGTAKLLSDAGINVTEVADYTGFPEMLDGRVKTLHPKIHAGLLSKRADQEHQKVMKTHGFKSIDLVVVNLYPFQQTIAQAECSFEHAIENIDIGGPAMLRSAAKNHADVTVIVDPNDYHEVIQEMQTNKQTVNATLRFKLATKVFAHTAQYDGAIANYLSALDQPDQTKKHIYPETLTLQFSRAQEMRYGENPHQSAAFYRDPEPLANTLAHYKQHQGKALSYNNIADADAAWECVKTFDQTACVIVKHANPCGVAISENTSDSLLTAYTRAFQTDPTSAFGGILAFNRAIDSAAAEAMSQQFSEVIIAPQFSEEALKVFANKPNLRLLEVPLASINNEQTHASSYFDFKRIGGGLLVQSPDIQNIHLESLRVVSQRQPTPQEMEDMLFAWRVAKFVKSNAIVFCANGMTLGIGAGQMSRIDSARIAAIKAQQAGLSLKNSAAASDAFFPFRDGLDAIVAAGASCVIHPGGSLRDEEVIAAANEHQIVMVLTGMRHFRH